MREETRKGGIWQIAVREMKRIFSRPVYFFGVILAPLFCCLFFLSLMENGLPTNLPLAVVDLDNSAMSRTLVRQLDAFEQSDVVLVTSDYSYARNQMQQGKVYGIFLIPASLTQEATSGKQPRVSFYMNHSYLIAGSLLFKDMRTMSVLASGAADRAVRRAKGQSDGYIMSQLQPIVIDTHPIGNPWLNYSVYLNNLLLPAVLQLLVLLISVFAIGSELKEESAEEWLRLSNGSIIKALIGKFIPYSCLFFFMGLFMITLLYKYLGFPNHSGILPMIVAMTLLILASQALGIFFLGLLRVFRLGLSAASLVGVLSVSITGFSFPVFAMDPILKLASNCFPLRHYFLIYINQSLNGAPIHYVIYNYLALILFLFLPLLVLIPLKKILSRNEYKM